MGEGRAAFSSWVLCLALTGCAVAEYPYPAAKWDPLVQQPDSDCHEFAGRYADRGERPEDPNKPSLTRELFGEFSDWEDATSVQLAMPKAGVLEVTVSGDKGKLFSRTLEGRDVACRGGRLILRDQHWIASYVMTGRQHIEVELNQADQRIVTQVEELAYGVMFIIFPMIGTARHWYRFERLGN
jgi:hypothetical protein